MLTRNKNTRGKLVQTVFSKGFVTELFSQSTLLVIKLIVTGKQIRWMYMIIDLIGIYSKADSEIQVTISHPQWTARTLWKWDVNLSCNQKYIREQSILHL